MRIAGVGAGGKAARLDCAAATGLNVPAGFVVPHGAIVVPTLTLRAPLIVRSAFSAEDGTARSLAGQFHTELHVASDPVSVSTAIENVHASGSALSGSALSGSALSGSALSGSALSGSALSGSALSGSALSGSARLDVLVMEQVEAVRAGVAFTQQQFEDDLVNLTDGLADELVGGGISGDRASLPKLRRWERPDAGLALWEQRLSRLLIGVRRVFGEADWDIEWADDDTTCWLVQVRPVTVAPSRNEAFTIANHKEILPELPSTFMTSIIERGAPDLLRFWAEADPTLPVDRPFVETFLGRPYLNLSLLTDLMRVLGLPTRLVTDSYGGQPDVDVGPRPLRTLAKTRTILRVGLHQIRAVRSADRVGARVEALEAGGAMGNVVRQAVVRQAVVGQGHL